MKVLHVLQAQPTQDGDGVNIRRVAGFDGRYLDPFLMLDELKSDDRKDYMGGFPPHPHRGIETFTYLIKGGFEHRDHLGNQKAIRSGDVQWMSTGRGVIHSEMPLAESEGLHGFQIWINMPSAEKMRPPRYQDSTSTPLPVIENGTGARLHALGGSWQVAEQIAESPLNNLAADAALADVELQPGGRLDLAPLHQSKVMVYIHTGSLAQGQYKAGDLLILEPGSDIALSSEQGGGTLILAGEPLKQPIAHMGPFVMTTQEELMQAVRDYQAGRFGTIE
ncbi:pirin family protein [Pseudoalteromonas sp. BDTF-M6]|uniref:pirin family protein n=1 Tax=Pseudoalteromonas sp. BDTF-M6 TaxID=2796132 RepID=UPI001BAEC7D4|nr:pirin family protein [Pseudoalteromonas sp. BDTF-M6]MBS3798531.1 pirin family protein [Pseudoalteromonas sp. BDTF-M6]